MKLIWIVLGAVVALCVLPILQELVSQEVAGWMQVAAKRLVRRAVQVLPLDQRALREEEWLAELKTRSDRPITSLVYAYWLRKAARRIARQSGGVPASRLSVANVLGRVATTLVSLLAFPLFVGLSFAVRVRWRRRVRARLDIRRPRELRTRRLRIYRAIDVVVLAAATAVGVLISPGDVTITLVGWGAAYFVATISILQIRGFYRFRMHDTAVDAVARIFAATSIAAMTLTLFRVLLDNGSQVSQQTVRIWGSALVLMIIGRLVLTFDRRLALARGEMALNTLIVGAGSLGHQIADRLRQRPGLGLRPIGFLDKEPLKKDGLPVLGASWDLETVLRQHQIEQVIVTFSTAPHAVLLGIIRQCRELGIEVAVVPRLFEEVHRRVAVEHLGGVPLLRLATVDPHGWQFSIKYALDRLIAGITLLLLLPLFVALAIAVRLGSPGPIFFRQQRIGLDGHEFEMFKFRTMRIDDDDRDFISRQGLALGGVEGIDRRTGVGRIMRRYSLDEMPQLLNVLRGDMSLVGPRPERTRFVRAFEEHVYRYGDRHRVKSGLTGWAQVQGLRGQTSLSDRVEWDNYYIESWSLWFDVKIVLATIPAVLGRADAV